MAFINTMHTNICSLLFWYADKVFRGNWWLISVYTTNGIEWRLGEEAGLTQLVP